MATQSTGISVTWNAVPFSEVTDVAISYGGGAPKGRDVAWTDEAGTVTVTCLGETNVSTSLYGLRAQLLVSGGGMSLTTYAVYEQFTMQPELNGVTRYTVTFKLLDG